MTSTIMNFKDYCTNKENAFCFDAVPDDSFPWEGKLDVMILYLQRNLANVDCLEDFVKIYHEFQSYKQFQNNTHNEFDMFTQRYDEVLSLMANDFPLLKMIIDLIDRRNHSSTSSCESTTSR
jgi:hypothetical protein